MESARGGEARVESRERLPDSGGCEHGGSRRPDRTQWGWRGRGGIRTDGGAVTEMGRKGIHWDFGLDPFNFGC